MKTFLCALIGWCVIGGVFADDTPGVVERTDCAALKTQIEQVGDTDADLLSELNAKYRRDCTARSAGRRNAGRVATMTVATPVAPAQVTSNVQAVIDEFMARRTENCDGLKNKIAAVANAESDDAKQLQNVFDTYCGDGAPVVALDPVQAAKNIDAGLCADGTKPNKFGCCTDETFKDLGGGEFGCCPNAGGDCFPPMK